MKRFSTVITAALLVQRSRTPGFYFGRQRREGDGAGRRSPAQADDLTAMQHNPAGLAQQQGFSPLADFRFLRVTR